jgi:hypothetical protein
VIPTFRYDAEKHEYWADHENGRSEQYVGVTGLIDYHGLISEYSKNQQAALRGQYAHLAGRYRFEDRLDWGLLDDQIRGYIQSLDLWIKLTGYVSEACEVQIFNEQLKLAGTYDNKGHMPDGARILLDLKSGVRERWHELQTSLYLLLEGGYRRRGSLYLRRSGKIARFHEHTNPSDEAMAISMLNVYRLKKEMNK